MIACPYINLTCYHLYKANTNKRTKENNPGNPKAVIILIVIVLIGIIILKLLPIVLKPYKIIKLRINFLKIPNILFFIVSPIKKYENI